MPNERPLRAACCAPVACRLQALTDSSPSPAPLSTQRVRAEGLPGATGAVFTTLPGGFDNPWHPCPSPQWVVCLSGSWWVEASDGARRELRAGELLWQDNTAACPAAKVPRHYSGCGASGCAQMIVQAEAFQPTVDAPGPW